MHAVLSANFLGQVWVSLAPADLTVHCIEEQQKCFSCQAWSHMSGIKANQHHKHWL